eukprot:gb/GEZN01003455.1/.p1 GENE.gb/GEZN01003455.1/~~gb/GEZN01003455.1/.p1  ORF type:complete len:669 (-),score=98.76 gb/GEZN01003455.1/:68-2074(-)
MPSKMEIMRQRQEKLRQRMKQRGFEAKVSAAAPAASPIGGAGLTVAGKGGDPQQLSPINKKKIEEAILLLLDSPRLVLPIESSSFCGKLRRAARQLEENSAKSDVNATTNQTLSSGGRAALAQTSSNPSHMSTPGGTRGKRMVQMYRNYESILTGTPEIALSPVVDAILTEFQNKQLLKLESIEYRQPAVSSFALAIPPSLLVIVQVHAQHQSFLDLRKQYPDLCHSSQFPRPPVKTEPSPTVTGLKRAASSVPGSPRSKSQQQSPALSPNASHGEKRAKREEREYFQKKEGTDGPDLLADLLSAPSAQEAKRKIQEAKIQELLSGKTTHERNIEDKYKSREGSMTVLAYCEDVTIPKCRLRRARCDRVHYIKVVTPGLTDESLGNCSYLDACRHKQKCRAVHYEIDQENLRLLKERLGHRKSLQPPKSAHQTKLYPPQFVKCDVRTFPFKILGDFNVIMADPPWDIHMELPYGTLTDQEMLDLDVGSLSKAGVIALWVTGRALDHGRKCMEKWGYKLCGELLWVKTNQLQRLTRTGRTGHWMNHSKEHCLLGIKGDPVIQRNLDCDVICAEVRETSRKPDEIYGLLERLSPNGRYLEIFGRPHNTRDGWVTLGNQNFHTQLAEPDMVERFKEVYPGVEFKDLTGANVAKDAAAATKQLEPKSGEPKS